MNEPQPKNQSQDPVTKKELEEFLKDQTTVILDAVDERLAEEIVARRRDDVRSVLQ